MHVHIFKSHSILQGIFPTQGLNLGLVHCRWILNCPSHQGSPKINCKININFLDSRVFLFEVFTNFWCCLLVPYQELRLEDSDHRVSTIAWKRFPLVSLRPYNFSALRKKSSCQEEGMSSQLLPAWRIVARKKE